MKKKIFKGLVYTVIIGAIMTVFSTVAIADVSGWKDASSTYNVDGVQNEERAYTQNDQYAILNNNGDNVTYGFGNSIVPAGAIIEGIEVSVDAFINNTSIRTYDLQLYTGTTARGSAINSGTLATTDTNTYKVFGSSTSDWGYGSWTAANVNTLRIKVTTTDGTNNIYLDHIQVRVYYSMTTYDITYNLDGGTNNISNPATYNQATPTINLADPTKAGYTFDGWYSDAGFTTEVTSIPMGSTGDVELYAKWIIDTYDITYNLGGGTNNVSNPAGYSVTTPTITFADPTRAGYTFDGWYSDAGFGVEITSIPMGSTGDVELYAKWVINTYNITYNLAGGINSGSNPATYKVTTPTINFAAPTRTGYTFGGWYSDAGLTAGITSIPMGSTGDVELYAKWIVKVFNINYETGGGVNSNENPWTYDIDGDDIVLRPPQRPGYVFGGWYDNPELTGNAITRIPVDSASDYTLYAKWIAIPVVPNLPQTGQYALLLGALGAISIGGTGLVVLRKKK